MEADERPVSKLRERRQELGLRQKDVANLADCSEALVSMVESGYLPTLDKRRRLAAAVEVEPDTLW